ncbi:LysR family transcriptional regulator [Nocardia callitridis]|uniref:LysR family transcriptional regulator n=1 Tax=Nocardia callitridis TaxID=648753 RepID=A0ABP9K3V3_9NOCA
MLDISHLQLLRTIVATGSLRASAAALGYTPSAASQQLATLQRQTGLRLVERVGRGIEPTTTGRALATEAEALFAELGRLDGLVGDLRAGRVGSLSIGYVASVGASWLPPLIDVLRREFPELRLALHLDEFGSGGSDVQVFIEDTAEQPAGSVSVRRLLSDPYHVILRDDDPLAQRSGVPIGELAQRSWIDNERRDGVCRRILLAACAEAGVTPRFQVQAPDYRTALPLVATGIGITVLPQLAVVDLPAGLCARPLTAPAPIRHVGLAVRESVAHTPAVQRAVELFTALAADSVPITA